MKKIYISGKIGNLPESEYKPKFQEACHFYRSIGFNAVSPLEVSHEHDRSWASYMIEDLKALKDCHAIAMLDNYKDSPGAMLELAFANGMSLEVRHFNIDKQAYDPKTQS